jgi:antitoxin ParD1/3/4
MSHPGDVFGSPCYNGTADTIMQITLSKPELEKFVEEQVRAGRFASAEEAISGALSLLQAHEHLTPEELSHLRAAIQVGIDQADRGEVEAWDPQEISAEVERRFSEEQKGA